MTQQILSWFTPTRLRPVSYFTVRISTKKINRSVYTILLPARTPLHPAENTLLKPTAVTGAYTESTVNPRTTLADPLSKLHHTQNPLCATRLLLNPSVSHTLCTIHCTYQNYQSRQFKQIPIQHNFWIQIITITNALLYLNRLQNRNKRRSKKAYSVRFNQQNSISNHN